MRKLVFGINVTIDGCCDHTKGIPDNNVHQYFTQLTREADALLYGRKTYQLMVPFWLNLAKESSGVDQVTAEFAQAFEAVPRIYVASRTLGPVEGEKTTILRSDLKETILKLKQEPGRSILTGGVDVPSQLIEHGLVDEIHLVIHPVVVGKGRRLFDDTDLLERAEFKLINSKIFKSGGVALHYSR